MIIWLLKFNIFIALGYILFKVIFEKGTTLQARRFYILGVIALATVFPLINKIFATSNYNAVLNLPDAFIVNAPLNGVESINGNTFLNQLQWVYYFGALIMLILPIYRLLILAKMVGQSRKSKFNHYIVLTSEQIKAPASFFNLLFMPEGLDVRSYALILSHEKLHARQWHSADVLLFEIIKIFSWFNPFLYLLQRELQFVHECLADKSAGETQQLVYQELLVKYHLSTTINPLTNHFNNSSNLKRRIIMLNASFSKNTTIKKLTLVIPMLLLVGMLQLTAQTSTMGDKEITIEKMPEFPGGQAALMNYLGSNITYPKSAQTAGVEGTAIVEFVIAKNGKVKSATIKKGVNPEIDSEALRVVNNMPKWIPGENEGKKVEVNYVIPIRFALN